MKTIIHITGASGSGKTTIGTHIAKLGLYVIDTDDIDDKNALDMLQKGKKLNRDAVKRKNTKDFAKIINNCPDTIVIVGRIIDMANVLKMVKDHTFYGYYLNVDADTIFRRVNLRHLNQIKKHMSEMETLLKSDTDPEIILAINLHKFQMRRVFMLDFSVLKEGIKNDKIKAKKNKYKIMTAENIIGSVAQIINK